MRKEANTAIKSVGILARAEFLCLLPFFILSQSLGVALNDFFCANSSTWHLITISLDFESVENLKGKEARERAI